MLHTFSNFKVLPSRISDVEILSGVELGILNSKGATYEICKAHKIVEEFWKASRLEATPLAINSQVYHAQSGGNLIAENLAAITINEYFVKPLVTIANESQKFTSTPGYKKTTKLINSFK